MSLYGGLWRVEVWRHPDDPLPGDRWTDTIYNGVDINDFNGGDRFELVISATPTIERARVLSHTTEGSSTTIDSVDLATFQIKPEPPEFQTSELRIMVTEDGQDRLIIITPAEEVSDQSNGFDIISVDYVVQPDGSATGTERP